MKRTIFSWLYVLFTAISMLLIAHTVNKFSALLTLFLTSLFAAIFFHMLNLKHLLKMYRICFNYKKEVFFLCINVLFVWVLTFYASAKLGSFGIIFISFLVSAIISYGVIQIQKKKIFDMHLGVIISLLLILILGSMCMVHTKMINNMDGMWLAVLAGIGSYFYRKQSYIFSKKTNLQATQVLAVRFYAILIIIGCLSYKEFYSINLTTLVSMLMLSFIVFIIPIFLNQKGIIEFGAEKHSIISATCPTVVYIFQAVYDGVWSSEMMAIAIIASALLIMGSLDFKKSVRS